MKLIVRNWVSFFICLFFYFRKNVKILKSTVVFFNFKSGSNSNSVEVENAFISHSNITISGENNRVIIRGDLIRCSIDIIGDNNVVIFEGDTKIHFVKIIQRGSGCCISVGEQSSIEGAFMVCMGIDNRIEIGRKCMLSDSIDIWNSDSHPVFGSDGQLINESKPIFIKDHVWIGKGVKILKGITIAEDSIVGMGAIVTKDIDKRGSLCVGTPARPIKSGLSWNRHFITEFALGVSYNEELL